MAAIYKIVILCLCLKIDTSMAIGCNHVSSDCIKSITDNTIVEKFQKMFCPVQKRFLHCWQMCPEHELEIHYPSFQHLREARDLCNENGPYTNESIEYAKCLTTYFYQDFLECAENAEQSHRTPSKHVAPNQGFVNTLIHNDCVGTDVIKRLCGMGAENSILKLRNYRLKGVVNQVFSSGIFR